MRTLAFITAAVVFVSCGIAPVETSTSIEDEAQGFDALNGDKADHACQIVLREISRPMKGTELETICNKNGVCYYPFEAQVDVASAAIQSKTKVGLIYRGTSTKWTTVKGVSIAGAPKGFQRYKFRFEPNILNAGMSPSSVQGAKLEVIPYVSPKSGTRIFDHNRVTNDLDVYVLNIHNNFAVGQDPNICPGDEVPSTGTLRFEAGFRQIQSGGLIAGGKGLIQYDINRLTNCRATHNGYPGWDIIAHVRFQPSGVEIQNTVRAFDAPNGVPHAGTEHSLPYLFDIPKNATSIEVWFENSGVCGPSTYDSNMGNNYVYAVEPKMTPQVAWVGNVRSSFSRDCTSRAGISEPVTLDSYIMQRACAFVELEVWVPGVTDINAVRPELLIANVEMSLDGTPMPTRWMEFVSRVDNNYRFHFEIPRTDLFYGPKWSTFKYTMGFSTDGVHFTKDMTRTIERDPTFCNAAWGDCSR